MKIAIVLAISVIFASGIYTVHAEEPIPELIFEGGDYTIHSGNHIHVPVMVQIENHDHKIFPKLHTIYENQIIDSLLFKQSNSGFYQTFLNINENYATGSYYLQLDYDGKKSTPIQFTIIREHETQQERILGFGDYTSKLYKQKQSHLNLTHNHIDIEFSTLEHQNITGLYDARGMSGKLELKIDGPKNMINTIRMTEEGLFHTNLIIDREWPTGNYKVTGTVNGKSFASNEFTLKNNNKDSLLKDEPITGIVNLNSIKSNNLNVLKIDGTINGNSLPEKIGIKIYDVGQELDVLYADVKESGDFDTSLVLYDPVRKSTWIEGLYTVELVNSGTLDSYEISSEFQITELANVVTDLEQGVLLTSDTSSKLLELEQILQVEKYDPQEIKIFGIIDAYISGSPIIVSVVNDDGNVEEFSVFGKKDGQYSAPVLIDENWSPGKYNIYVNYKDEIQNSVSFSIENQEKPIIDVNVEDEENTTSKTLVIDEFVILQNDSSTNQFLQLDFSTNSSNFFNLLDVMIEKPDGSSDIYTVRTDENGSFDVALIVENSWIAGSYSLSFDENGEKITFGKFSIIKEESKPEPKILSELLETANPQAVYKRNNSFTLEHDELIIPRGGVHLDIRGHLDDFSNKETVLNIYDGVDISSTHKISLTSNGDFFSSILIDDATSTGYHEVHLVHDDVIVGKSEFLALEPITLNAKFSSTPLKITPDMFVDSVNTISVNLVGFIDDYSYDDYGYVKFTTLHSDGKVETASVDTAKWGYYSYQVPITNEWEKGTYIVSAEFNEKKIGHLYIQISDFDSNWFKEHTEKWVKNEISSYQYENRINTYVENGLTTLTPVSHGSIPDWMKMNAERWINDELSQKDFFDIITYVTLS